MKNFDKIIKKYSTLITKDTVSFTIKTSKFTYTYYPKTNITILAENSEQASAAKLDNEAEDLLAAA